MRVGVAEAPNAEGRAEAPPVESAVFGAGTSGATNRSPGVDACEGGRGRAGTQRRLRPGDPLPQDARLGRSARAWAEVRLGVAYGKVLRRDVKSQGRSRW